jgi:signal transduction histidine kinase
MLKLKFEYKFVISYIIIGGLWIKFSDSAVNSVFNDPIIITRIQTYKGWAFVAITAVFFFFIIKQHLIKIRLAEQKAKESDRLKTMFLQNISHEIRTPMNGIIGFSELLTYHSIDEETKLEYINIIKDSSFQLLSIVNDVLDISMIESGNIKINHEPIHLNSLLDELYQLFIPTFPKNVSVKISKDLPDSKCMILSDKTKLQQILNNLLNNAIKYTPKGTIHYGYSVYKNELRFFVEDTGIGMSEELQTKIFNRFLKAEEGFTKYYQGVGLGLAICKGHVSLLNGKIWVQSAKERGTTFYFTLPYTQDK